jgi:hypothetical protein
MTDVEAVQKHTGARYTPQEIKDWLEWAADAGLLFKCVDNNGTAGLMIVRPRVTPEVGELHEFEEQGTFLHIDYCYAEDKQALRDLVRVAAYVFGERQYVVTQRENGKLKFHPWKQVVQSVLRR